MYYSIRLAVAIVTFGLGSGLAWLISPSATNTNWIRNDHCRKVRQNSPVERPSELIKPEWVFVKRGLDWNKGTFLPAGDGSDRRVEVESTHAEIAIFYPSGKFAFLVCNLLRDPNEPTRIFYDDQFERGNVYLGTWTRTSSKKIVTVADLSHHTGGISDRPLRKHLEDRWDVDPGEPKDQYVMLANGTPFGHLNNFASLPLLSTLVLRPARLHYIKINADR